MTDKRIRTFERLCDYVLILAIIALIICKITS